MKLHHSLRTESRRRNSQAGVSLIETMIALALLLIASAGIMTLATVAMSTTETQGHLASRTAEYAQDKMEQLLALNYLDTQTDTTVFPAVVSPGVGKGLTVGGGLNPNAPVVGYSDYVDAAGNPVAAAANWAYVRVWQITQAAPNMIQISVLTQVRHSIGFTSQTGIIPRSTVTSLKSNPF
ncbi:MAG TPA: prepilin-type N-terminal cleavage/methylation domain-containing protein [Candidatus Acidoferrum sp.]|nr:prepilin-type N-terminal cleavage/methylation domain-containing protein [Candidatus Acidoferrum sp.]